MASTSVFFDIIGKDHASDKFDAVGRSASKTEGKMSKLGSVMKAGTKVGMLAAAAGAVAAGKALFDMAKGAAEDHSAAVRLATALKNTTGATKGQIGAVEDWISKQGVLYGVTDDDLRPALGKLAAATHDIGKAQNLASLAMDISAGSGKSLEAVSTALAKAQNGQVSGLARLGISVKDAKGKTVDFATAQQRLADTFKGQAAKQANTYEGKMQRLKVALSETGEAIGYKLLPIMTKLSGWVLSTGLPAMQRFGGWLSQHIPPVFDRIRSVIATFVTNNSAKITAFANGVRTTFSAAIGAFRTIWAKFGPIITKYLVDSIRNAMIYLRGAFRIIKGIFEVATAILTGDWRKAWRGIKDILHGAWEVIEGLVRQGWNIVKTLFRTAGVVVKGIFSGLWDGVRTLARNGVTSLVDLIRAVPGKITALGGMFLRAGQSLIGKLWDGLRKVGTIGVQIGRNIWSGIASAINAAIRGVNDFLPNDIGIGPVKINLPDNPIPTIPGYARGTNFSRAGLAVVGERGPELVNLPGGSRVIPNHRIGGYMGGAPVVININGQTFATEASIGQAVAKALREARRQYGRAALAI